MIPLLHLTSHKIVAWVNCPREAFLLLFGQQELGSPHKYVENTVKQYVYCVQNLVKHFMRPPDELTVDFQLHLTKERKVAWGTFNVHRMVGELEKKLIQRKKGQARSIRLPIPVDDLLRLK